MDTYTNREKLRAEAQKIIHYLNEWQKQHPKISPENNANFKIEFAKFLDQNNISKETRAIF